MNRRSKLSRDHTKPVLVKSKKLTNQEKKASQQEAALRAKNWYCNQQLEKIKNRKKNETVTLDNAIPSDSEQMIRSEAPYMANTTSHLITEEPMTDRQAMQTFLKSLIAERDEINGTITLLRKRLKNSHS